MFSQPSILRALRALRPLLVTSLLASGAAAHADNLNTSGSACHHYVPSEVLDIGYNANGILNVATAARQIICPIPRSPLTATPTPTFYVDGHNNASTTTACLLTVYAYNGTVTQSQTVLESGGAAGTTWDAPVTFPTLLGTYDYVTMICSLPPSSGGLLYGVTAVQP